MDQLYNTDRSRDEDEETGDLFEDEVEPEASSFRKSSSRSIEDGPILIPMNPDADADLLGSIPVKHASKAKKDARMKGIVYLSSDVSTLESDRKKASSWDDDDDEFLDDDDVDDDDETGGSAKGLLSRFRRKIAAAAAATPKTTDAKSASETAPSSTLSALQDGGNSLPHPDSVMRGHSRDILQESDSEDEDALDENGKSLPHPDEMIRNLGTTGTTTEQKYLDANGNSLPHPEEMVRVSGTTGTTTEEDALDANGNSLPHPDTLMGVEETMLLNNALQRSSTTLGSSTSAGSYENDRLLAALADTASNDSDDYYNATTDDEDDEEIKRLKGSGKALVPNSGGISSLRFGNFRMSLNSFSNAKNKSDPDLSDDSDSDSDEDSFQDEEKMNPSSDRDLLDLGNNDRLAFDENGMPMPRSERDVNEEKKRKFTLQSMRQGVTKVFRPSKPKGLVTTKPDSLFADADEENIFVVDDIDSFDDEDEKDRSSSESKKERLLNKLKEQKNNPRSRITCIALVVFLLFLATLIPLVKRGKNKELVDGPADAPAINAVRPTSPPLPGSESVPEFDPLCEDEIVLTDKLGRAMDDSMLNAPCYLSSQTIYFRFKRCRPASELDWVGIYPAGSMFMDRLWKDYYDGIYLCGGQPCSGQEIPEEMVTKVPPIPDLGIYRLFLIKDSKWPFEYIKYTPSFNVVSDMSQCPGFTNPGILPPDPDGALATSAPTFRSTEGATVFGTSSGTFSGTFSGTVSGTARTTLYNSWSSSLQNTNNFIGSGDGDNIFGSGDGDNNTGSGDGDNNAGSGDGDNAAGSGDGDNEAAGSGDGDNNAAGSGDGDNTAGSGDGDSPFDFFNSEDIGI